MENSSRFLERRFSALSRLDRETLVFLLPPYDRLSAKLDDMSKLDIIELIIKDRIISL